MTTRHGDDIHDNRNAYMPTASYSTDDNIGRSTLTTPLMTDQRRGDSIPNSDFGVYGSTHRDHVRGPVDADELRRRLETHTTLFGDTVRDIHETHAPVVPLEQQYMADWRTVTSTPRLAEATPLDDRRHSGVTSRRLSDCSDAFRRPNDVDV